MSFSKPRISCGKQGKSLVEMAVKSSAHLGSILKTSLVDLVLD